MSGIMLPHSPASSFQLLFRVNYMQRRSAIVAKSPKISSLRAVFFWGLEVGKKEKDKGDTEKTGSEVLVSNM